MDLNTRINTHFEGLIQDQIQVMPVLATVLEKAARLLVEGLLRGGKVLCCGNGASAATAQHFTHMMLNGLGRPRPGLPAFALSADQSVLTGIAANQRFDEVYANQVTTLGQPGDILLVICDSGNQSSLRRAVIVAKDRQMNVIALTGPRGEAIVQPFTGGDVEIRVNLDAVGRVNALHLLAIHCLNDLVDAQLLGN